MKKLLLSLLAMLGVATIAVAETETQWTELAGVSVTTSLTEVSWTTLEDYTSIKFEITYSGSADYAAGAVYFGNDEDAKTIAQVTNPDASYGDWDLVRIGKQTGYQSYEWGYTDIEVTYDITTLKTDVDALRSTNNLTTPSSGFYVSYWSPATGVKVYGGVEVEETTEEPESGNNGNETAKTIFLGPSANNTWTGFNNYDLELAYPCTLQGINGYGGADVILADANGNTSFELTENEQTITLKLSELKDAFLKVVYNDASNTDTYSYTIDADGNYIVTIPASTDSNLPTDATAFSFMIGVSNGDATSEVTIDDLPLLDNEEMTLEVENVWWCPAVSSATFFDKKATNDNNGDPQSISSYSVFFYVDEEISLTENTAIAIDIEDACSELQTVGFWCDFYVDEETGSTTGIAVVCPENGTGVATIDLSNAEGKTLAGVGKISGLSFKLNGVSGLAAGTKVCTINSVILYPNGVDTDGSTTAISSVSSNVEAVEVARYNLMGQKLSGAEKGINIIVYSDGTAKKVLVK